MVVQHNIPALNSYRNLGINNSNLAKNLEKLSSGYRINRAGDDAAGLAISEKMRGQIRGLGMAEQNAENGISLIQTAEGGLNETHDILQRMRELAVQSSNGTYQDEDRKQIELEYQALKQEIDRIASYTNYNGIKLLDGTVGGVMLSNTDAAQQITGNAADVLLEMGVTETAIQRGITIDADVAAKITSADKTISDQDITDGLTGFNGTAAPTFTPDAANPAITAEGNTNQLATKTAAGSITMTKKDDGTWDVDISDVHAGTDDTLSNVLKNSTATYDGTSLVITDADGDSYTFTGLTASTNFGGLAAGTTVSMEVSYATAADSKLTITAGSYGEVQGEYVNYPQEDATNADIVGNVDFTWDAENQAWNVSGEATLTSDTNSYTETISFEDSFIPADLATTDTVEITGKMADGNKFTVTLAAGVFTAPAEADLADNSSFSVAINGAEGTTALTGAVTDIQAYKYDTPAEATPDQLRADRMLDAMGLSNASEFNVSRSLETGNTEMKALWESLNGKDAYIITRDSTADADRSVYNADSKFETILQVNGTSYHGVQNGGNIDFKATLEDGSEVTIATLTMAGEAVETGTVRFNIGNVYKSDGVTENNYYESFLVKKEGAQIGTEDQAELVFQIGANGTEDQRIGMYVLNMSSDNLGNHAKGNFVADSSIVTRDEANKAVDTLDYAINYVSSQRANLGALQNRLEHTLNNLGVTKENITAAESSIRDTDMAEEMMEFTKNNILSQASQAMLAQANQLPQGVLQLLG